MTNDFEGETNNPLRDIFDDGKEITLTGVSGEIYEGKIYSKSDSSLVFPANAIIGLASSEDASSIKDIYISRNPKVDLENAKNNNDITHVVIIPKKPAEFGRIDKVDDLKQKYLK